MLNATAGNADAIEVSVLGYGLTCAAGIGVHSVWNALSEGRDCARAVSTREWPVESKVSAPAALWKDSVDPALDGATVSIRRELGRAIAESFASLTVETRDRLREGHHRLGVVFATTKGAIDDFIWTAEGSARLGTTEDTDGFSPLVDSILADASLRPDRVACVSNACASSHSAMFLAREWLDEGAIDDVILLAVDRIGPFILQGFSALRALSPDHARPFAVDRNGLRLGEGAAAIILSRFPGPYRILGIGIDAEGFAVTRPSQAGESLRRACLRARTTEDSAWPPSFVIAHGTATVVNDSIEARVFSDLFASEPHSPPITGSKGAIGHTLGASGAIDLILAFEALRRGSVFPLTNTRSIDPEWSGNFALETRDLPPSPAYRSALITSLGFGGIHAAIWAEAVSAGDDRARARTPASRENRDRSRGKLASITPHVIGPFESLTLEIALPVRGGAAPPWAALVDRWYQLDSCAFALAEAAWRWKNESARRPDFLILASPGGSTRTDRRFALESAATSPSVFVHTLPNVRSSAFCQVLGWSGALLCLQRDPHTFEDAIATAGTLLANGTARNPWILSVERASEGDERVTRYRLSENTGGSIPPGSIS